MYSKNIGSSSTRSQQYSNHLPPTSSSRPRPVSSRPSREPDRSEWAPTSRPRPTSAEVLVIRPAPATPPDTDDKTRYPSRKPFDTGGKDEAPNEPVEERSTFQLDCWHCLMMFANVILLAGGMTGFILGAWMIFDNTFTGRFIGANLYLVTVYVLLGCGFFSVCLAVIGCVGAVKAAKCLILMYMIIAVAIVMTMLLGALSIAIFRKWVNQITEEHMRSLLDSYAVNSVIRDAWDTTQQYLHCCGVHSSADWHKQDIPASCCDDNHCRNKEDVYKAGCLEETEHFFDQHVYNIAGVFVGVQLVLLFGLITSCGYYKALSRYGV